MYQNAYMGGGCSDPECERGGGESSLISHEPALLPIEHDYSGFDIVKATQYGALGRVKELIDAGWDVNQPDSETVTLLHWASINNRRDIIQYFLKQGAIVDALGGELNATPLHWATRQGHLGAVVLLLAAGADPSLRDAEGCSCIHLAAQFGHTALVAYFIARGVHPDLQDRGGMTALMWSAWKVAALDPVRLLLTLGANPSLTDHTHGNTALHWAILARNTTTISTLILKVRKRKCFAAIFGGLWGDECMAQGSTSRVRRSTLRPPENATNSIPRDFEKKNFQGWGDECMAQG